MFNESIIATGIYYIDQENITANSLAFRQSVLEPEDYQQNEYHFQSPRLVLCPNMRSLQ